jgi:hypothetical protein
VGENRPRGGRELLSRTGKQTDWEEPPIESKTQLNTQIGGIENSSAMIIFCSQLVDAIVLEGMGLPTTGFDARSELPTDPTARYGASVRRTSAVTRIS